MYEINEATFFYSSLKKDRWGAFETDERGPEKQFFLFPNWPNTNSDNFKYLL